MYLANIHNFRTIAILGIVGAHSLHNFDWEGHRLLFLSFDSLFNESSIWFFFIAGYLFQHLSRNFETKKYYVSKIKNVIIPYLILSIPAIIASLTFVTQEMPPDFESRHIIEKIFLFLITGKHLAPFWFVPTISIIYLFAPALIKADRAKWPYYALPVLLILSCFLGRSGFLDLTGISGYFSPISKVIYLFPAYYFGMFCSKFKKEIAERVISFRFTLIIIAAASYWAQVMLPNGLIEYIFIFKISSAMLLVHYLDIYGKDILSRISYVGTASFGIFFIHGYFLAAIKILKEPLTGSPVFDFNIAGLIAFIVVFTALSCLVLWLAQKIFGHRSRLLVGV